MSEPPTDARPPVEAGIPAAGRAGGEAVVVRPEPWGSTVADVLVAELEVDLGRRYPDEGGEVDLELAGIDPVHVGEPLGRFLVAWRGERPVGCGAIRPAPAEVAGTVATCEIKRMYVRPEARGRGVSRALLAGLEAEAARLGYRRVVLETGVNQPEALALYESSGYSPIDAYGAYRASPLSRCYERVLAPA